MRSPRAAPVTSSCAWGAAADHVVVDVIDDGIGLPAVLLARGVAGLGLSIVHALVTGELDGSIEMHDANGTTVHVQVPVAMPRVEL